MAVLAAVQAGTGGAAAAPEDAVVAYDFEPVIGTDLSTTNLENGGAAPVATSVVTANGGTVDGVNSWAEGGHALRLPAFDASTSGPRAVVKVVNTSPTDVLAPGSRDFSWSADFTLDADSWSSARTSRDNGDNLFQRGLFNDTQFKLDVDGRRPSCRVRGSTGSTGAVRVTAPLTVSAAQWYRATCTRTGNTLTVSVSELGEDGAVTQQWSNSATSRRGFGSLTWPRTGTPVTIGGKLTASGTLAGPSSDQFNGIVDNAELDFH